MVMVGLDPSYVQKKLFDAAEFVFPYASETFPNGTKVFVVTTSCALLVLGVSVAVYVVPEPVIFVRTPFVTLTLDVVKEGISLENVKVNVMFDALLLIPDSIVLEMTTVGGTGSKPHSNVFVLDSFVRPYTSSNESLDTKTETSCALVLVVGAILAVYVVPEPVK